MASAGNSNPQRCTGYKEMPESITPCLVLIGPTRQRCKILAEDRSGSCYRSYSGSTHKPKSVDHLRFNS